MRAWPRGLPARKESLCPAGHFRARAPELGAAFAALAVELDGEAVTPPPGRAGSRWRRSAPRRRGGRPAGMGPAGRVAVRVGGDRREADRRQHSLALVRGRQAAFHASYPAMTA